MKTQLQTILFLMIAYFPSVGQEVMTFRSTTEHNVSIKSLDSVYKSGIHANPTLAVFSDTKAYMEKYVKLLTDLGKFLKENDFIWEKETRGFNRIYFSEDGTIDYFIYQFNPGQINSKEKSRFEELLKEFVKDYKFGLEADVKFAQCSPVKYMPLKEK